MDNRACFRVAFIGTVGVPNRYGGFEAFLEHCAPEIARRVESVVVTCDAAAYEDHSEWFCGVKRIFIGVRANGVWSIFHDFVAFFRVFFASTHIVILGVSGGPWFPIFRALCAVSGKKLVVNVDGVEWQRGKFSKVKRLLLRAFDFSAQIFSHRVVFDNRALAPFLIPACVGKAVMIPYSGDHVIRVPGVGRRVGVALTVCRIEPENNIEMLIEGVLASSFSEYTLIGNWESSDYGRGLKKFYSGSGGGRVTLLDPIYDSELLARYREECEVYIHGHSVGGTNPSLVEMVYYDSRILCFDVPFHHETVGECAEYFRSSEELAFLLDTSTVYKSAGREKLRESYRASVISEQYVSVFDTP